MYITILCIMSILTLKVVTVSSGAKSVAPYGVAPSPTRGRIIHMESIEQMDLKTVIALFEESSLGEMELTCSRYSLKFTIQGEGEYVPSEPRVSQKITKVETPVAEAKQQQEDVETITSPIVGTFYLTPAPDAPSYVQVGDMVEEGDIICTIEAMKMMNQLQTDFACEIVSVLAKPEEMVEFGQPLFTVRRR